MNQLQKCKQRVFFLNSYKLSKLTLELIIKYKQIKMHDLAETTGMLTHPHVIQLSQEIDKYMVQLQKIKMKK